MYYFQSILWITLLITLTYGFRLHQLAHQDMEINKLEEDQFTNATLLRSSSSIMELRLKNRVVNLLNVPDVMQATPYTCGPSSLSAVLNYFKLTYRQSHLAQLAKTDKQFGTGPQNLLLAIKHLNISAGMKEGMTIKQLQDFINSKLPIIVQIQAWADIGTNYTKDFDDGHYVVVIGYDQNYLYFEDPWIIGSIGYISKKQFPERWHDKVHSQKRNVFSLGIIVNAPQKNHQVIRQIN